MTIEPMTEPHAHFTGAARRWACGCDRMMCGGRGSDDALTMRFEAKSSTLGHTGQSAHVDHYPRSHAALWSRPVIHSHLMFAGFRNE